MLGLEVVVPKGLYFAAARDNSVLWVAEDLTQSLVSRVD